MIERWVTAAIAAAALLIVGHGNCVDASGRPSVAVSILPQKEFVERIAGARVRVEVLVQPGQSPATYEPTPKQMTHLAEADLWIRIGVPFERSVLRNVADVAPQLRVIDGTDGIALRRMDDESIPSDSRLGSEHVHRLDPHFWLDPTLVKRHALTIADTLCDLSPIDCEHFESNFENFRHDLDAVDRRVAATLAPIAGRDLFVFHPAYGYFAGRYGLRQIAVEVGGKQPTSRQLAALIDAARASGIRALFIQPQYSGGSARAVADAMGVALVELDPLAAEYIKNLDTMAARIVASYGE